MNATGLPIPSLPATPAQPTTDAGAPLVGGSQAPTDFVLALAQMVGTGVPTQTQALPVQVATDDEIELPTGEPFAGLLPLPFLQQLPTESYAGGESLNAADPLEMLGLTARPDVTNARDAALLQALTERLAGVGDAVPADSLTPSGIASAEVSHARPTTTHTAPHSQSLHQPVGTRAWADELGSRLTMMTDKGQHTASIRLSPENLGPLEIRIAMRDDQASVWFGAAHADTRAAIEHALPRLRELFAEQGMTLADAGVFKEPPKQAPAEWKGNRAADVGSTDEPAAAATVQVGLLDAYA